MEKINTNNPVENLEKAPEPMILKIDLSEAWNTDSEADIFIQGLKDAGIHKEDLLFCGYDGRKNFRTNSTLFAAWEDDLHIGSDGDAENPIDYAFSTKKPAIAIIDSKKLSCALPGKYPGVWKNCQIQMNPEALVAICYLKDNK